MYFHAKSLMLLETILGMISLKGIKKAFDQIGLVFIIILFSSWTQDTVLFTVKEGNIHFVSEAPLELIEAQSDQLIGILSSENHSFAFSVPSASFIGFNSLLQKEHYNENYMESEVYTSATFTGNIIEEIDLLSPGKMRVRAKGKFTIHGVEKVQLIDVDLTISENSITIESSFTIQLKDYKIEIPRIVNKKIAETIQITVNARLEKK
jgi:hypothetical protein